MSLKRYAWVFLLPLLLAGDLQAQLSTACVPDPGKPWCFDGSSIRPTRSSTPVRIEDYKVTAGSGTGVTVNVQGAVTRQVYKATIASTNFVAAAVTADVTVATIPAKSKVVDIRADLTETFACTAVCTSTTLSFVLGKTVGGNQYLVSFDADAATGQFGDADAELGTSINRANAIQGGDLPSWTATTALTLRLTSGTGNIGDGDATNLSQGSVTVYITTEQFP